MLDKYLYWFSRMPSNHEIQSSKAILYYVLKPIKVLTNITSSINFNTFGPWKDEDIYTLKLFTFQVC